MILYLNSESHTTQLHETVKLIKSQPVAVVVVCGSSKSNSSSSLQYYY